MPATMGTFGGLPRSSWRYRTSWRSSSRTAGPDPAAGADMNESETVNSTIGAARRCITVPPVGGSG